MLVFERILHTRLSEPNPVFLGILRVWHFIVKYLNPTTLPDLRQEKVLGIWWKYSTFFGNPNPTSYMKFQTIRSEFDLLLSDDIRIRLFDIRFTTSLHFSFPFSCVEKFYWVHVCKLQIEFCGQKKPTKVELTHVASFFFNGVLTVFVLYKGSIHKIGSEPMGGGGLF